MSLLLYPESIMIYSIIHQLQYYCKNVFFFTQFALAVTQMLTYGINIYFI